MTLTKEMNALQLKVYDDLNEGKKSKVMYNLERYGLNVDGVKGLWNPVDLLNLLSGVEGVAPNLQFVRRNFNQVKQILLEELELCQ